jgi:hypothetical protein
VYDQAWHHMAARKTGTSKIELFIDGKLEASDTTLGATGSLTNAVALYIGDRDGTDNGDEFNGDIDEVKVYRGALTDEQIRIDYNQGQATMMGALSTASDGTSASFSSTREYCVPGDTATCSIPFGEWKFDERTGTSITNDTSTSGNTGSLNGFTAASWTAGKFGSALDFDGTEDYVSAAGVDLAGDKTISVWVYPHTFSTLATIDRRIIYNYIDANTSYQLTTYDNGSTDGFVFAVNDSGTQYITDYENGGAGYSPNAWYHLVGVYNDTSKTVQLYINGQPVSDANNATNWGITTTPGLFIGRRNAPSGYYDGLIDQVRIYDYQRTAAQIAWEYNRGAPIAHYKFNECQGTMAFNAAPTANETAAGNDGTITIGTLSTNTSAGSCTGSSGEAWKDGANGKFGSSLEFDGSDDYVLITDPADGSLDFGTGPMTISAWIKTSQLPTSAAYILDKKNGGSFNGGYQLGITSSDQLLFRVSNGSSSQNTNHSPTLANDGNWHHVVGVLERGISTDTLRLYLDGIQVSMNTSVPAGFNIDSTHNLNIGRQTNNTNFFNGQIDDVRLYNYALTVKQIQLLYNENSAVRFGPNTGSP